MNEIISGMPMGRGNGKKNEINHMWPIVEDG